MLFKRKAKRIPPERRSVSQTEPICQKGFGSEMPPQKDLLRIVSDEMGIAAVLIEKAYWIMHVLHGLKSQGFLNLS